MITPAEVTTIVMPKAQQYPGRDRSSLLSTRELLVFAENYSLLNMYFAILSTLEAIILILIRYLIGSNVIVEDLLVCGVGVALMQTSMVLKANVNVPPIGSVFRSSVTLFKSKNPQQVDESEDFETTPLFADWGYSSDSTE